MSGTGGRHLPALGWDPCPGDVEGTRAVVDDLRVVARALREGERSARADAQAWRGAAAAQHRERVEALPACLHLVAGSVQALAAVVEGWAGALARLQVRADELERRMREARDAMGEASVAAARLTRSAAGEDVVRGRLLGTTALLRSRDLLEGAAERQAAVEAQAQRLHLDYAEEAAAAERAAAAAVDDGLRAPWTGLVRSAASPDGGWVHPRRDAGVVLDRLWEDVAVEAVHLHAGRVAAASDGAAVLAEATGALPLAPAQGVSRVLGAGSELCYAGLDLVVAGDGAGALTHVGLAGTSLVAGALPRRLWRGGADAARRVEVLEHGQDVLVGGVPGGPPAPEPWEVPGHEGTAVRRPDEVRRRAEVARDAALDRVRTSDVRRCVEG